MVGLSLYTFECGVISESNTVTDLHGLLTGLWFRAGPGRSVRPRPILAGGGQRPCGALMVPTISYGSALERTRWCRRIAVRGRRRSPRTSYRGWPPGVVVG